MRTGYRDIRALSDPLMQYNWDLIIPVIPGVSGTERSIVVQSLTTSLPGMTLADVDVIIKGMQIRYAGQRQFAHDLECTYHETRQLIIRDTFLGWIKYARSVDGLTGKYKSAYATTANLILYDDTGAEIRNVPFVGFYPKVVADTGLDGTQAGASVQVSVTFSYDSFQED